MKRTPETLHFITPESEGWAVWRGTDRLELASTLAEAAGLLPAGARFDFAMPCHPLILERLRLPAVERDELAGMVQLQWEKALPFAPEEITGAFAVVESTDDGVVVWSAAASRDAFKEFGDIWSKANRWPEHIVPYVCYVAVACPEHETVLVVYREQGHWVVAVIENQRPGWVHVMSAVDPHSFAAEFLSLMLTAGLDGVPNTFSKVLISPELSEFKSLLRDTVNAPVETLPTVTPFESQAMNLLPAEWQNAARRDRTTKVWRRRALAAAAVYLIFAAVAGIDLLVLHFRASRLGSELDAQRPTLTLLQNRQSRYNSLAAAVDSRHYTIEVLYLLQRCLPADSVRFTEFEQMPDQWRVVGEAPSAGLATEYLLRLKHDADLSANDISADPPRLITKDRAQFQVVGKP